MTQKAWIDRAQEVLPAAGFGNFDPGIMVREGHAAHVWDMDGNQYVDYLIGSGPMILGHSDPEVLTVVHQQVDRGLTFFANNSAAVELAEEICRAVPCAEQLRYVSTGGEADMYAMRLARAYTGRNKIIKFEGGYHGMSAEAQMSLMPTDLIDFPTAKPDSAGIPDSVADEILISPYNDINYVRQLIDQHRGQIAGIIVEPLQRIVPPTPGFLQALRDECSNKDLVLIFDEVVTGFRLAYGGAQERYGVTPDLCTLGKIIGGGFPLAAITGNRNIMVHFDKSKVSADQWLMQIGTLSGNPIAAAAGLKTLEILRRPGQYEKLEALGHSIQTMLRESLSEHGIAHRILGEASLFEVVLIDKEVNNYRDLLGANSAQSALFNKLLRAQGVFKSPGKIYPCLALTDDDLALTQEAIRIAAAGLV